MTEQPNSLRVRIRRFLDTWVAEVVGVVVGLTLLVLFTFAIGGCASAERRTDGEVMCAADPDHCGRAEYDLPPCDFTPGASGVRLDGAGDQGPQPFVLAEECRPSTACMEARIKAEKEGEPWPC